MRNLLDADRGHRAFWLLVALALGLLVNVSFTAAQARPASLVHGLARDLGALQLQIERLKPLEPGQPAAGALPADLGDGSQRFLWQAGDQMVRRARRRVGQLQELALGHPSGSEPASTLWVELYEFELQLEGLRGADGPGAAVARRTTARDRLDRMQRLLPALERWLQAAPAHEADLLPRAENRQRRAG